jgi:hypothetical protein
MRAQYPSQSSVTSNPYTAPETSADERQRNAVVFVFAPVLRHGRGCRGRSDDA